MEPASRIQGAVQSVTRFFSRRTKEIVAPRLAHPVRYPFGEFEFQLHAAPGQPVELQTSRDFKSWEPLDSLTAGKDMSVVSDKKAGNYAALYYRAVTGDLISNYIGFVSFEMPPGYSMITHPLKAESPKISDLFPAVPEGTSVNKFNLVTFALNKSVFTNGKWSNLTDTLMPGEGALVRNPTDVPIVARFVGEIPREPQSLPVQTGTSMRGSLLPFAGRLDTDLGFPVSPGEIVSLYSNHNEKYIEAKFTENGWEAEPPYLRLGEAFWIAKNSPSVWKQKLPEVK